MKTAEFNVGGYSIVAVPVLRDNFVFLVCRNGQAVLVDAGEAQPVFDALERRRLQLLEILITHTHADHVGGARAIHERTGVLAHSPGVEERGLFLMETPCQVISTPGHMAVHKCYHFPDLGVLFSGDTLINGACGRLLGGTMEQHYESFRRLAELPDETRVFGGHDYLADNMAFALSVEPGNADMQARLDRYRSDPAAAIFATLAEEKKTNPFLRARSLEDFADLRRRKDDF